MKPLPTRQNMKLAYIFYIEDFYGDGIAVSSTRIVGMTILVIPTESINGRISLGFRRNASLSMKPFRLSLFEFLSPCRMTIFVSY
jgi:hypothetical protein